MIPGFWRKVPDSGTDCGTPVGDLLRLSVFSLQKLAYGHCQFVTLPYHSLQTIVKRPNHCDSAVIIIIMYIYHTLIGNALSAHMIHINLNMTFYTHVD